MDEEEDLYDEFGNYIGPDLDSGDDDDNDEIEVGDDDSGDDDDDDDEKEEAGDVEMGDDDDDTRIVLHEDKKYYPTSIEVYGEEVETTVQEEDTQAITQPIVAPIKAKDYDFVERKQPETVYSTDFFTSLMPHAHLVRNVAVVGHMSHGKTTLVDNLVGLTHVFDDARTKKRSERGGRSGDDGERYTDSRVDEQKRGLSIKAAPMTLLLQSSSEKRVLVRRMDALRGARGEL